MTDQPTTTKPLSARIRERVASRMSLAAIPPDVAALLVEAANELDLSAAIAAAEIEARDIRSRQAAAVIAGLTPPDHPMLSDYLAYFGTDGREADVDFDISPYKADSAIAAHAVHDALTEIMSSVEGAAAMHGSPVGALVLDEVARRNPAAHRELLGLVASDEAPQDGGADESQWPDTREVAQSGHQAAVPQDPPA